MRFGGQQFRPQNLLATATPMQSGRVFDTEGHRGGLPSPPEVRLFIFPEAIRAKVESAREKRHVANDGEGLQRGVEDVA